MGYRSSAAEAVDLSAAPGEVVVAEARRCVASGRSMIIGGSVDTGRVPAEGHLVTVTSGSSGRPRAILRTLASWTDSFPAFSRLTGINPDDRVALTGSPQVSLHLFAALQADGIGASVVADLHEATVVHCVPAVLTDLLGRRLPRLRMAVVAGSMLAPTLADRAADRGIQLVEYYGAAELSLVAIGAPGQLKPFPGCTVELRDRVLWVRSPWLSRGYLPDATGDGRPGPFRTDNRGFATVGDLAQVRDGDIAISGRGDSAIVVGGATVLIADVESALLGTPGVRAGCVVPRRHDRLGQVLAAVVELEGSAQLEAVKNRIRRRLRDAALPRYWLAVEQLPRLRGGKVDRLSVGRLIDRNVRPS